MQEKKVSKRADAFDALENSLPNVKSRNAKLLYLGRILVKMSEDGLITPKGRTWYITDKGEKDFRL